MGLDETLSGYSGGFSAFSLLLIVGKVFIVQNYTYTEFTGCVRGYETEESALLQPSHHTSTSHSTLVHI